MAKYGNGMVARDIDAGSVIYEGERFTNFDQTINPLEEGIKKWDEETN